MTAFLVAALLIAPNATLRYHFVKGQERVYELTETFVNPLHDETTRNVDEFRFRVEEVNESGAAKIVVSRKALKCQMEEVDVPVDPNLKPTVTSEWRSPRGDVRKREAYYLEPRANARILRLFDLLYPGPAVATGDVWTTSWPAEEGLKLPRADWRYRLSALTAETARFEFACTEKGADQPISSKGFAEIDLKSGWPRRIELKAANVELPGDEEHAPTVYTAVLLAKAAK